MNLPDLRAASLSAMVVSAGCEQSRFQGPHGRFGYDGGPPDQADPARVRLDEHGVQIGARLVERAVLVAHQHKRQPARQAEPQKTVGGQVVQLHGFVAPGKGDLQVRVGAVPKAVIEIPGQKRPAACLPGLVVGVGQGQARLPGFADGAESLNAQWPAQCGQGVFCRQDLGDQGPAAPLRLGMGGRGPMVVFRSNCCGDILTVSL